MMTGDQKTTTECIFLFINYIALRGAQAEYLRRLACAFELAEVCTVAAATACWRFCYFPHISARTFSQSKYFDIPVCCLKAIQMDIIDEMVVFSPTGCRKCITPGMERLSFPYSCIPPCIPRVRAWHKSL